MGDMKQATITESTLLEASVQNLVARDVCTSDLT
jgi:hypothetical protein